MVSACSCHTGEPDVGCYRPEEAALSEKELPLMLAKNLQRVWICPCRSALSVALLALILSSGIVHGQDVSTVEGKITGVSGVLPGVQVHLVGTGFGAVTDSDGAYHFEAAPGTYILEARFVGFDGERKEITLLPKSTYRIDLELQPATLFLQNVIVTATGERQSRKDIAASIGSIGRDEIVRANPGHPSEIMQRVPGVWVSQTAGEGHMTAIRQPLNTEPVYLYLEDGIPTRSTGFFNHNALYEINIPQAESVEILKGPGTALYGSDAIGGVINVTTRSAPNEPTLGVSAEGGSHGFGRVLASIGTDVANGGLSLSLNVTRSDGWRDATAYERQSGTLRWDLRLPRNQTLKTVLAVSNVDQAPAGSAALSEEDYLDDATQNYTPVSFRQVQAVRLSSEYERVNAGSILTVTPYFRYNTMDLLPNWSLSFDPATWETSNYSVGLIAKHRTDFTTMRARLIGGVDLDLSPGERIETRVDATREGKIWTSYTTAEALYDYDVSFRQAAPFLHGELSPNASLRLTGGLRVDLLDYDYENNLGVVAEGSHRRAASTSRAFQHVSPKLGATYQFSDALNGFAAYNHAFRVPSENQLFRQGSTSNTLDLEPVKVNSYELGLRGSPASWLEGEVSLYLMNKNDDIVTFTDTDGIRISTNAGATSHKGVELGLTFQPIRQVRFEGGLTVAKHTYEDWQPSATEDLSGNEMAVAPRESSNLILTLEPDFLSGSFLSLEWIHLGSYWTDPENTSKYDGHELVNLRASVPVTDRITLFSRIINLTDRLYAERVTYNTFRGDEFAPGIPRSGYVGIRFNMGGS